MKKSPLYFSFSLLFTLSLLSLDLGAQSEYKATHEGWLTNIDEAYALSQKTGKPILANFTGSDWCGWCKRLSAAVFLTEDFKKWAAKKVVLLELDFPRRKTLPEKIRNQNYSLQQAFQVTGYPTVWVFDLEQEKATKKYNIKALGKTGYMASVKDFMAGVDQMIAKRT